MNRREFVEAVLSGMGVLALRAPSDGKMPGETSQVIVVEHWKRDGVIYTRYEFPVCVPMFFREVGGRSTSITMLPPIDMDYHLGEGGSIEGLIRYGVEQNAMWDSYAEHHAVVADVHGRPGVKGVGVFPCEMRPVVDYYIPEILRKIDRTMVVRGVGIISQRRVDYGEVECH
jgi:hypothetical protein